MFKVTSLSDTSDAYTLPYGEGVIVVSSASTLTSAVEISIGDDIWVPDKDNTEPSANGAYTVAIGAKGRVRLAVTGGSCTLQILEQSAEKSR